MIERLSDTVCDLHRAQEDEERGFLGLASKLRSTVSPSLTSKLVATVSPVLTLKPVATILVIWPQNHSLGFLGLGLKTGSYGLMIWPTKSPRRFLGLCYKIKWAMVCWLYHKTDRRMKTAWDTRQDLVACFAWKRVRLEFFNLASRMAEARRRWCTWHHHGGHMEMKSNTDGSTRWATLDSSTPNFVVFCCIRA
jgi:hypothetical protein